MAWRCHPTAIADVEAYTYLHLALVAGIVLVAVETVRYAARRGAVRGAAPRGPADSAD